MPFNKKKKTNKKQNTKQKRKTDGQIFINLELPMIINLELPVIREYNKKGFSSDEGLTLEPSVFKFLYSGQFTISTKLIKLTPFFNYFTFPLTKHHGHFFTKLYPFTLDVKECFTSHNREPIFLTKKPRQRLL